MGLGGGGVGPRLRGGFEGARGGREGGAGRVGARRWFLYVGLCSPALGDGGFVDVGGQGYVPEADAVGLEEGDVLVGVAGGFASGNYVPELRQAGEIYDAALDGLMEISAFEGGLFTVINDDGVSFALHGIQIDFAAQEGVGADGVEVRALFQPRSFQHGFIGVGGGDDDIGFGGGLRVVDRLHGDADLLAHALGELISPTLVTSIGENARDVSDGADGSHLRARLRSDADDSDGLACVLARHVFCGNAAGRAGA